MSDEIPVPDEYLQCIEPFKQALEAAQQDPQDLQQILEYVEMAHAEIQRLFDDTDWEERDTYFADLRSRLEAADPDEYPGLLRGAVERFLKETADVDDLMEKFV